MTASVVSLNTGSSSIKFALFDLGPDGNPVRSAGGAIDAIGEAPRLRVKDAAGAVLEDRTWPAHLGHDALLDALMDWAGPLLADRRLVGVGHRVVHGGPTLDGPRLFDPALMESLEALSSLAPLHQPHNLSGVRAVVALRPDLPQVGCFDTAFHHDLPHAATRFALPRRFHDEGVRRYGFHGLSYASVARTLADLDPALARGRVITAHLGAGASLCAMRDGRSLDTTMGFTALDGLVMATRCGALDPGVVLHLQTVMGLSTEAVERLLYQQSGLLGISGLSGDMRALAASPRREAAEAIEIFVWRAAREIGALMSSLDGLDGLVFTAGVGENAPDIRNRICRRLAWAGVRLDAAANARGDAVISAPDSAVVVRIVATDEEWMIARQVFDILEIGHDAAH